ncbi:3-phenylpropionate/trans-cinnamate dioxygenase ferredoxin reductase subunit [Labrenzia sp. EL_208]|uniref:Rhodocoxin reductase n=1 Tax=Roseibium album TaxID=311410 RepID=A0A0M7A7M7_9HYPH|nr:FAD-dependent oxidoreductase [Roseibium album]MBG6157213.1 3-phenylpropionate/trans-cinnamate dioxygenase ferredoxin reductase subunit [Labrenzia sp. EL_162]MBG6166724.1 3-phenylpropionate/trans-cinnamate dioxygenase ferredoxin reductase subunit [Labrenzia sp. EL_195]MBG6177768.1 3-phenylpropionate/trans-cinnamate dioxygenase ferredoxin reductase subunit [Labrenzia sp. EL_132]MBG6196393.1 3-phenylpropionate/trans-cinnamate dioxygenase ferredoxin reductase subunit [Labrenzia sp. EL_159]MBG62
MQEEIVIIGAGQAGAQLAHSLRQGGFEGPLRLIGDEPHPPYQRPPLSKKYLSGDVGAEGLWLRPPAFFETNQIDHIPNTKAVSIDRAAKRVHLENGDTLAYGKLVLATGTNARTLPLKGADKTGVVTLRSIADVDAIRDGLSSSSGIAIIGAGYIGLEVAAVAKAMGKSVSVIEAQDRPMKRVVSQAVSDYFTRLHRDKGIDLRLETGIESIEGDETVTGVKLSNGDVISAELVLIAVGAEPNDHLAAETGLEVDNGVLVDGSGQTSDPNIYAVGDCTRFYSNRYQRSVRMESVQNAIDQAKAAAQSLLGEDIDYDPVPWFWSDQYDIKLQIAGLSEGYDETIVVGSPADHKFYVAYLNKRKLIAVDSINFPRSHMLARRVIGETWREGLLPDA